MNGGVPPVAQAAVAPVQQQPQQPQTTGLEGGGKGLDISAQVMAERDNGCPRGSLLCKFSRLGLIRSLVYRWVTKYFPRWPRVTAVAMEDSCAEEPIDITRSCRSSCQKNGPGHEWYTGDHARNVCAMIRRTPITLPDLCTDHCSCTRHRARNVHLQYQHACHHDVGLTSTGILGYRPDLSDLTCPTCATFFAEVYYA